MDSSFAITYHKYISLSPLVRKYEVAVVKYAKRVDELQLLLKNEGNILDSCHKLIRNAMIGDPEAVALVVAFGENIGRFNKWVSIPPDYSPLGKYTLTDLLYSVVDKLKTISGTMNKLDVTRRRLIEKYTQKPVTQMIEILHDIFNDPLYQQEVHNYLLVCTQFNQASDLMIAYLYEATKQFHRCMEYFNRIIELYSPNVRDYVAPRHGGGFIANLKRYKQTLNIMYDQMKKYSKEITEHYHDKVKGYEIEYRNIFSIDPNMNNKFIGYGDFRQVVQDYTNILRAIDLNITSLKKEEMLLDAREKQMGKINDAFNVYRDATHDALESALDRRFDSLGALIGRKSRDIVIEANKINTCLKVDSANFKACVEKLLGNEKNSKVKLTQLMAYQDFINYLHEKGSEKIKYHAQLLQLHQMTSDAMKDVTKELAEQQVVNIKGMTNPIVNSIANSAKVIASVADNSAKEIKKYFDEFTKVMESTMNDTTLSDEQKRDILKAVESVNSDLEKRMEAVMEVISRDKQLYKDELKQEKANQPYIKRDIAPIIRDFLELKQSTKKFDEVIKRFRTTVNDVSQLQNLKDSVSNIFGKKKEEKGQEGGKKKRSKKSKSKKAKKAKDGKKKKSKKTKKPKKKSA
jgi:tetratricopeptide (TPR) repeat protein